MPKRWIHGRRALFDDLESLPTRSDDDAEDDGPDDAEAMVDDLHIEVEPDDEPDVFEFAALYADDSDALARWKDQLSEYVDLQGTLDALRLRPSTEQPWPPSDNPMLAYLRERAVEIVANEGVAAAVTWLAANAWFEGAIAERSRFIRLLDAD